MNQDQLATPVGELLNQAASKAISAGIDAMDLMKAFAWQRRLKLSESELEDIGKAMAVQMATLITLDYAVGSQKWSTVDAGLREALGDRYDELNVQATAELLTACWLQKFVASSKESAKVLQESLKGSKGKGFV